MLHIFGQLKKSSYFGKRKTLYHPSWSILKQFLNFFKSNQYGVNISICLGWATLQSWLFSSVVCIFTAYIIILIIRVATWRVKCGQILECLSQLTIHRLRLESFPRSVSSSIFCMDLLSAFNNARFKFQGSGSNTLEVMSICLNHIKLKKFQENL